MSYIDDAFDNLKSNLEITETESKQAQSRHELIRDHVRKYWELNDDFLTGSYARHTMTKRLKDVDIFVVIDLEGSQKSLADKPSYHAVQSLHDILALRWQDLSVDDNVVTVNYGDDDVASYEIAPVFERSAGGYWMPNGSNWIATDPKKQAELVTAKNKTCDSKFVPFIKLVKGINREAGDPIDPSFLLETMALQLVMEPFKQYRHEIRFFLASVADQMMNDWSDPVGIGPDVNAGIPYSQRRQLADIVQNWLYTAEEALQLEAEGKERASVETWRELFGWRMPRP